ncbi:MAG TPA: MFS transporter, partial [bacterium]|nr:MFS transporter [bacterium]
MRKKDSGKNSHGKLHPVVWATAAVSFFTDFSSELIYPLLPIFFTSALGLNRQFIGLIEGIAESAASILKLFSGRLSDRIGKRTPLVAAGYSISSAAKPLIAIVSTGPQALALRFMDRLGKGIRTSPRDALINDATEPGVRGKAFGVQRAVDNLGAITGSLAAFAAMNLLGIPIRTVIMFSAVPGVIAVLVIVLFVRDVKQKESPLKDGAAPAGFITPRNFKVYLCVLAVFALGNS